LTLVTTSIQAAPRPTVVLILADDLGYRKLGIRKLRWDKPTGKSCGSVVRVTQRQCPGTFAI
jgi:hypothetical protein